MSLLGCTVGEEIFSFGHQIWVKSDAVDSHDTISVAAALFHGIQMDAKSHDPTMPNQALWYIDSCFMSSHLFPICELIFT
jgi:hypothetical protein